MNSLISNHLRRSLLLGAILAVAAGAPSALGQKTQPGDEDVKGSFDQPIGHGQGGSHTTMMMSESDGDDTYTVKINGDEVSAEINGKAVPKDRIRRKDGKVEILDKNGEVLKSFNVNIGKDFVAGRGGVFTAPRPGQNRFKVERAPGGRIELHQLQPGEAPQAWMTEQPEPPPVMMGITMSDPGEGEGIMIDSVIDGLPADKAGLEVGDRIVSVDGKKAEGQGSLREVLKKKEAGDKVVLKIERDGKEKEVTVTLAKYDAEKLPQMQNMMGMGQGGDQNPFAWHFDSGDAAKAIDEAREQLKKALEEFKSNENLKADKIKAKAEQALEEALEALEKAREKMSMKFDQLHDNLAMKLHGMQGVPGMQLFGDGQNGNAFWVPAPPQPPNPDVNHQLERLSEQLEKLNDRLEKLEKDRK